MEEWYFTVCTHTHTHTHREAHTSFMHARKYNPPYTHTHRHPHKARVRCSLMPPVELSLDFVSLPPCIFSGSDERWARLRRSARSERDESWPASPGSCSPKPRPWPSRAQVLGLAPLSHYLQAFKNTPETQWFNPLLRCSHQNWMKKKKLNPSYLLTVKLLRLKPTHKRQLGHPGKNWIPRYPGEVAAW